MDKITKNSTNNNGQIDSDKIISNIEKWLSDKMDYYQDGNKHNYLVKLFAACNRAGVPLGTAKQEISFKYANAASASPVDPQNIYNIGDEIYTTYSSDYGKAPFTNSEFNEYGYKLANEAKTPTQEPPEQYAFTAADILAAKDQETLWAFFTKGVNNALVASSEAGKSTLVLNLAIDIALEEETFLGFPLNTTKGRCIYVSTEDGMPQIKHRLEKMLAGRTFDPDNLIFIMEATDLIKRLEEELKRKPADFLFIDTWGDLIGGKYEAQETRTLMQNIKRICVKYDCTPVYVHHTNKVSENIPDKSSIKGAGDFEQACRVVIMLCVYREQRWLSCVKGNPFAEDFKQTCYELSLSGETLSFSRTGRIMPRKDLVSAIKAESAGKAAKSIYWPDILKSDHLNKPDIIKRLKDYGIGKSQAYARTDEAIQLNIIKTDSNGMYYHELSADVQISG